MVELRGRGIFVRYAAEYDNIFWKEHWLQTRLGCDFGQRVRLIIVEDRRPTEREWELMERCQTEVLSFGRVPQGDSLLIHLRSMKRLRNVNFVRTAISADEVERMHTLPSVTKLGLHHADLSDAHFQRLTTLTQLRQLYLSDNEITDEQFMKLAKLHELEKLLLHTPNITLAGIQQLRAAMPQCEIYWEEEYKKKLIR